MPQTLPIPFCGRKRRPRLSNLPPTARRGEGDHEVVEGAAEGGLIKLAAKPPPPPSEPGPRSGPSSRPLPSRCARHPPPGRGWAGNMEERNVASNPAYPILWEKKETTPFKLASHRSSGGGGPRSGGGGRRRRPYKTCGEAATTTLGLKGRQT